MNRSHREMSMTVCPDQWLEELRAQLPVVENCTYFQTGSLGPLSRPVLDAMQKAEELAARAGPAAPQALEPLAETSDAARAALAQLLHADVDAIGWSGNTSQALRTVIQSLELTANDRLLTSDQEHVATRSLYNGLIDAVGLEVVIVNTGGGDERFLAGLEAALQQPCPGRQLLLLSHVSCIDGSRLPVPEAVVLARRHGAITLVDGAQAVGQIPVDLAAIDADFYVGSLHKWLLGPSGLGYFHVQRQRWDRFNPNWLPNGDRHNGTSVARLGEVGTANRAQHAGAQIAVERMAAIGVETVAAHCRELADQLRAGLGQLPGVRLLGPDAAARRTGLLSFTVQDWTAQECRALVQRLYLEQQILIKFQPEPTALRVSLAAFNTADEVVALLAALAQELPSTAGIKK